MWPRRIPSGETSSRRFCAAIPKSTGVACNWPRQPGVAACSPRAWAWLRACGLHLHLIENLRIIRHPESHQREQRIAFGRSIRQKLRIGVAGIVPSPVVEFVFAAGDLYFDVPVFSIHLRIRGSVRQGVVMRPIVNRVTHGVSQSIGVVESMTAGILRQRFHGNLVGESIRITSSKVHPLRPPGGSHSRVERGLAHKTHRCHRINGHLVRSEFVGRPSDLALILARHARIRKC